jgi:hypothetical protein
LPNKELFELKNGTWLGGIGSGAWFKIEQQLNITTYRIARYTATGKKDFEGLFSINKTCFNPLTAYQFMHPTNCKDVFIKQENKIYSLKKNH